MRSVLVYAKNKLALLAAISLAAIIGGLTTSIVMASIPDGSGVIHGCRTNATGSVRIIDSASQSCNGLETGINWSQTGPQGATGPQGPAGTNNVSSNRLNVSYGDAASQQILSIPNFGEIDVAHCDGTVGATLVYHNTTGHDVQYGDQAQVISGDSTSEVSSISAQLGYSSGGVNYVTAIQASVLNNFNGSACDFSAQATASQN